MKRFFLITLLMVFAFMANATNPENGRAVGTHWSYNPYTQYNMTLTGVVYLDGESMQNDPRSQYLEVGAFCGEECRGSYTATLNPAPFAQGYFYQMQIYSEVQSGETLTFRIWDHQASEELDVTYTSNTTFVADEGYGNLMYPYELTFTSNGDTPPTPPTETHWTHNPYTQYNMTLTGIVKLDGESMQNDTRSQYLEVGAFCGDECRGAFLATLNPAPFAQGYFYLMQIYSEVQSGETITFRIWDHEAGEELDVTCTSNITFEADAGLGNLMNPYELTFITDGGPTPTYFMISATADPTEGGSVEGAGQYEANTTCYLTATANDGYSFVNWTKDGEVVWTDSIYSFTVTEDAEYVAHFSLNIPTVFISAIADPVEGGTVSGAGEYEVGSTCTLTATANEGYTFVNWTKDGVVISTEPIYSFTVIEEYETYVAHFSLNVPSYMITATADPAEGGSVEGAGEYEANTTCTLVATANEGYTFVNWTKTSDGGETPPTPPTPPTTTHWTHNPYTQYNMTLTGIVKLNGESMQNETRSQYLEVAAFCGDECRGAFLATLNPAPFAQGYFYLMQIYSELQTGETITFRIWDHEAGEELGVTCTSNITFEADAGLGNLMNPYELTFVASRDAMSNNSVYADSLRDGANDEVVSTDPIYSFTVTEDAEYVAHFSLNSYQITATVNPIEAGSVTGAGTYTYGTSCTLTVTPNEGYTFSNWTKDGEVVSTDLTYTFTVTEDAAYVANFGIDSYEITATVNPVEAGSVTGAGTYTYGTSCTLTVTPNEGYTFSNWTKDGEVVSTDLTYTFTVTEDAAYVANFGIDSYEITATVNPVEAGSVTGAGTYTYGTSCTLTVTPNEGYTFSNWTKDGEVVSTDLAYTFTVTEDAAYVANFGIDSYEITATANPTAGGTVTGAGTYNYGQSCTLTATAEEGYTFINWTKDGEEVSDTPTYTFTVTEAGTYVANFEINSYTITATTNPTEAGTITGAGIYNYGEEVTLSVTANAGYTFINWTKNGEEVSTAMSFTITVTEDATYVANFSVDGYEITATTNPVGAGTITGNGVYNYGEEVTLSVTPNAGYTFINWTKDGEEVSTAMSFTITVTEDAAYVANFSVNTYEITATVNPTDAGTITGTGTYNYGDEVTLSVTANAGYTFINWTKDGEEVSTAMSFTITVTEDAAYVANFSVDSYTITAMANPADAGTVTGAGTYNYGTSVTLTATAEEGYIFVNWTKDGDVVSTSPNYTITVTEDATYVANFEIATYEITVSANPTTGGTVTGGGTFNYLETCTLTATPAENYIFVNWSKDGVVVSTDAVYSFSVVGSGNYVATFAANEFQINVSANPSNGGIVTGAGVYGYGATATLTATANSGFDFVNWTKNGVVVSMDATYSFTVTESGNYVAHFSANSYQITAMANPAEGGTITGDGSYEHGQICTLTATAAEGYTFVNWTKNGTVVSNNTSYSFTVTENATYVANFSVNMYMITVSADPTVGGTVAGGGAYLYGSSCTVTAMANAGYTFTNWTKNGTVVSTDAAYTFIVTEDANLVAHFSLDHYIITVSVDPEVGGTATGGGSFTYGETCTLTATPNSGYAFVNWTKNGSVVSSNATYSFSVMDNGDYVAHFSVAQYTITLLAQPAEGGNVFGAGTYDFGHVVTLRAIANEGYEFVNWTRDGGVVSSSANYPIVVREDAEYVANFRSIVFEIKANTDPDNTGDIEGVGFYTYGETCTLTVTPHAEYEFVNWTLNGEVVSEEESISFVVTEARDYVAHLQHVDGIDEQGGITIALYPNPAKRRLIVEASEPVNMLEIYNINGALVYRQNNCSDKVEINVETFATGTYMIRLTTDSAVEIRRFVKE